MSRMPIKERSSKIYDALTQYFPDARCELNHVGAFQLLIATILSAQCTDVQVNKVTPILFKKFPTPAMMANASLTDLMEIIKSTGFYKSKAKNIKLCSQKLVMEFYEKVPKTMAELTSLPGVGRKTANVVLGNAFNINDGIVVDTHVKRISNLLNLTNKANPVKIEQDLVKIFPQKTWCNLSHLFIFLGRKICVARRPRCEECPINIYCPSKKINKSSKF